MAEHPEKVLHPARWPRAEVPFFSFLELCWVVYAGPIVAEGHLKWEQFLGDVADDAIEAARALESFPPCPWWREL